MRLKLISTLCITVLFTSCVSKKSLPSDVNTSEEKVLEIINLVNTSWQKNNPNPGNPFWDNAAYHTGNMAAYAVTKNSTYKEYSEKWAQKNNWKGATSNNKAEWKYSYGEKPAYVLFGDWQICFQTYIDLYNLDEVKDPKKIARAVEVMQYQMNTPNNDYWWWADGLYMAMPVMTKLYKLTGDEKYLDKLYEYFQFADNLMFDKDAHLYYRDAKYIYPKHKSVNGLRDFWARGDGWVFAGLAKVLGDLPKDNKHYDFFLTRYKQMGVALAKSQQEEGYWTRSILDPTHAPGPETSGTAFITYGYLWGMNNGILDKLEYTPTIQKSWKYLTEFALQADGAVGYVQPIGEKAIPGQVVNQNSTSNFGVGAFLLASTEMYKFLTK
ncbi:MAG: glycoside hydrolase family 88 protein [Pelobium sp.]